MDLEGRIKETSQETHCICVIFEEYILHILHMWYNI